MSHSLIPERPVLVSPSLAASIGLEEAILLQHLEACCQFSNGHPNSTSATANGNSQSAYGKSHLPQGYQWAHLSLSALAEQLPFWTPASVRRILRSLVDLGMLIIDTLPSSESHSFAFAINQQSAAEPIASPRRSAHQPGLGGQKIDAQWQPDAAVITQLQQQGVAPSFILSAVDEFVLYWRERNEISHSWSSKFLQHVNRRWQQDKQHQHDRTARLTQRSTSNPQGMQPSWQPSIDAVEILLRMGIHQNFLDDAIAEFVLYWQERGDAQATWNSKFVTHVKRQWARYTHTLKHDTEPVPMYENWQPDHEVFDVLAIANIEEQFAKELVPEFMMYWRDKNELHHSWNTKFLQYVKHQWSRTHQAKEHNANGKHGQTDEKRRTRDRSLLEDLTDRSWAN
mgnify:FL=1|jgi:hypothetical protein